MSLTVYAYTLDQNKKMKGTLSENYWESADWKEITHEERMRRVAMSGRGKHLAGPEAARQELWGSEAMISLGLVLLPGLAKHDVYVVDDRLDLLAREIQIILQNVDQISAQTGYAADRISTYAHNIAEEIRQAKSIEGGVVIW